MTTLDELAARLDRVETELALRRLAVHYCVGADQRDLAVWRQVWTGDAVWDVSAGDPDDDEHRFRGLDAITAAVQRQWAVFPRMQHAAANHTDGVWRIAVRRVVQPFDLAPLPGHDGVYGVPDGG